MMSWPSDPELEVLVARLAPHARLSLERAARFAARLHADEVAPEHWLASLLGDEDCAATRLVLHAFADPETIGSEVLALCPGILVVGSDRCLPFSVLGLVALRSARSAAVARGGEEVEPLDVFRSARAQLPPDALERLELAAGEGRASPRPAPPVEAQAPAGPALPGEEPLFRRFSTSALRALGVACRVAGELERDAIGPAHLLVGALQVDERLRERTQLSPARVRLLLSGQDEDPTPAPARPLPAAPALRELLCGLSPDADTLDVLGWLLSHGSEELRSLLSRQRITPALHERSRGVFRDPEPASAPDPPDPRPPAAKG